MCDQYQENRWYESILYYIFTKNTVESPTKYSSMRVCWLLLLGASVSLIGCGSSKPLGYLYYETTQIRTPKATKGERANLLHTLSSTLGKRVVYQKRGGKKVKVYPGGGLKSLSHAALRAIWMASNKRYYGAEFDFKVRLPPKRVTPVSVWISLNGTITFKEGQWPKYKTPKSPEEVEARWKVGKLKRTKGRGWSDRALRAIDLAMAQLATEERKILKDIPFTRKKKSSDKRKGALYIQEGDCDAKIIIYDNAVTAQNLQFTGSLKKVLPATTMVILHEVGHGIHHRSYRKVQCQYIRDVNRRNRLAKKSNRARGKEQRTLVSQVNQLDKKISSLEKKVKKWRDRGPVLSAYKKVLKGRRGPTRYGETSLAESFAESFALYHTDPEALKRVFPRVYSWFKGHGHLKAMK